MKTFAFSALTLPLSLFASLSSNDFFKIRRAQREVDAHTVKSSVAAFDEQAPFKPQYKNGDEGRYRDLRGSFNKGLLHLENGFPNRRAFASLVKALSSGSNCDFNHILIGLGVYKLVNPQASFAYSLCANEGWLYSLPPAPAFSSAEAAGEMVELYWSALVRDVSFDTFSSDSIVAQACADLSSLSNFKGPKENGVVTPQTFMRGMTPGDLVGPYLSQFLCLDVPYGTTTIGAGQNVPASGVDFMTTFANWFQVVSGGKPNESSAPTTLRFIETPRDLAEFVRKDFPALGGTNALLILNSFGNAAIDPNNPYFSNGTQAGFVTYALPYALALVQEACSESLKATWYQKWQVHRRLRPEEFGFYVEQQVGEGADLGIHSDLLDSPVLAQIFGKFSSYFLPSAYPEGSPCHPAYPAGHAAFSGASVTILKALYNEDFVIPNPMQISGSSRIPYTDTPLTIGNELNKLAANIAIGRDIAGVHYRSDGWQGMLLGEKVAIDILKNAAFLCNEEFCGFKLTKFDGTKIIVGAKRKTL